MDSPGVAGPLHVPSNPPATMLTSCKPDYRRSDSPRRGGRIFAVSKSIFSIGFSKHIEKLTVESDKTS
jgi:hypothetical protein